MTMDLIVQKYGGSSLAGIDRINAVADRVCACVEKGDSIAVVLSAMGADTDRLVDMAETLSKNPDPRDMDILLATGEQVSVAMLAIALRERGTKCETFLGHQAGIMTDKNHGRARIRKMDVGRVRSALDEGRVAIVAGFQGVTEDGAITTIGRGGSDTTAVALAAALGAKRCEIFTDVDGIYTADPSICPDARLLDRSSYEEMMEITDAGARVLHDRAVEIAARHRVPVVVKSSFSDGEGTMIVPEESMEGAVVSGITCNTGEAKVSIRRVPDRVGITAEIFAPIAAAGIDVDLIIQTVSEEGFTELSFTVPKDDLRRALTLAELAARNVNAGRVSAAGDIAKVSIVGLGMRSHAGVAHRMFARLATEDISIQMIGTSEIKVSIVIDMKHAEHAVRVLHEEFGLSVELSEF